ncbi:hypothetical protein [Burkholderia vietnamiensis]|nr:hypothetical protein [Burkholderia vietnamiensis]
MITLDFTSIEALTGTAAANARAPRLTSVDAFLKNGSFNQPE